MKSLDLRTYIWLKEVVFGVSYILAPLLKIEVVPTLEFLNLNTDQVILHFIGHHKTKIVVRLGELYVNVDKNGGLLKLNNWLTC